MQSTTKTQSWIVRCGLGCAALILATLCVQNAPGYNRYNDGCQTCHGEFTDATSPQGTFFPSSNKHTMHRSSSYMNADCDLCHRSDDGRNAFIGSSNGTASSPGVGCTGCHNGAGLRAHHENNSVGCFVPCHTGGPAPEPENVMPVYYGVIADSNVNMPCNPTAAANTNENWSLGDFLGLDNDGDNLYDAADPDCSAAPCDGDTNNDGEVNTDDFLAVLAGWGSCPPPCPPSCDADVAGDDCQVNTDDFLAVLGNWGPCL